MGEAPGPAALELRSVSKAYVGVQALADASLSCYPGEVHALVGENGAGKSTLIKIASGAVHPDTGSVLINGEEVRRASTAHVRKLGLLTAYQDTSLIPRLTVAQNAVLSYHGVKKLGLRVPLAEAERMLEPYELPFRPSDRVSDLGPGGRQLLEVVRALIHNPRVLLLDEPTAALDADNIARLERLIAQATDRGAAILYISHRLDEVRRIAKRLTVLRDGRIQGSYASGGWDVDEIVTLMVGEETDLAFPDRPEVAARDTALKVTGLSGRGFGPVSLRIGKGEIVGIAGAEGNGQRGLLRSLVGVWGSEGEIAVDGKPVKLRSPSAATAAGIGFQSGDRAMEAVFADLSVATNSTFSLKGDLGPAGVIQRRREVSLFRRAAETLGIVHASPDQPIAELSGGNQQKAVLARAVLQPSKVLVVDDPTQGVDAKARLDIYRMLRKQADEGTAIVLGSSDSAELAGMCDRVYVLSRGRIVAELVGDHVAENTIVDTFVNVRPSEPETETKVEKKEEETKAKRSFWSFLANPWVERYGPLVVLIALIVGLGIYAESHSSLFLDKANLSGLLILTLPLMVVALGQQVALMSGGFDISVGSNMSLTVVLASYLVTSASFFASIPGILACLGAGVVIGLANATIVRGLKISPIIATIATLGIIQGLAIILREEPGGFVGEGLTNLVNTQIGFIPVAFIVFVVIAVLAELWLLFTSGGLTFRATGLFEEASRRNGVPVTRIKVTAYVVTAVAAVVAGLLLATQVGIGSNEVGVSFALPAFTACFLAGASLTGGRGSFIGVVLGALFLNMIINVTPLVSWPDATSQIATGVLTVVAVIAYSLVSQAERIGGRR